MVDRGDPKTKTPVQKNRGFFMLWLILIDQFLPGKLLVDVGCYRWSMMNSEYDFFCSGSRSFSGIADQFSQFFYQTAR